MLQKLTTSTRHRVAFTRRERRHKRTQDRRSRYYFRTLWNNCSLCGKFEIIRAPIRKKVQSDDACDERPKRNLKIPKKHKFSDSDSETRQMHRTLAQSQRLFFFHGVPKLQDWKRQKSGVGIKKFRFFINFQVSSRENSVLGPRDLRRRRSDDHDSRFRYALYQSLPESIAKQTTA